MRIRLIAGLVSLLLVVPLGLGVAFAQEEGATQMISWIFWVKPHAGQEAAFEAALRDHAAWHAENAPGETYGVGQVLTGERAGQYVVVVGDRTWADFDGMNSDMGRADEHHWASTGGQLSKQTGSIVSAAMPSVSRPPMGPFGVVQVFEFRVRFDKTEQFVDAIGRYHEALAGEGDMAYSWSSNLAGAVGPLFTVAVYHENFADMAPGDEIDLAAKLGEEEFAQLQKDFSECVIATESNIIAVRWDLSYMPAGE